MQRLRCFLFVLLLLGLIVISFTAWTMYQTTQTLKTLLTQIQVLQVYDRNHQPLSVSYQNRLNRYDNLSLYQIPEFLRTAFIASEDRQFFQHHGVNWMSRTRAVWQNLHAQHTVSGASTITEQVVRIIRPRSRTFLAKWFEGFDAYALEKQFSKTDILEFYLNQIPYAANRRGVLQAARYYFNRDLSTLSRKEMLALVVLTRAPSNFDLYHNSQKLNPVIDRLANYLRQQNLISEEQRQQIHTEKFYLQKPALPVNAVHFMEYVRAHPGGGQTNALHTTLDANLQRKVQAILDERLKNLVLQNVHNGAVLVADHTTGEILAWVVGGDAAQQINAVLTLRQPGSTLKPFLYALALEKGWTAATLIEDAPLEEAVGTGLHRFRNYSHGYYGQVTLREALGNSLNIPAIHAIQFVGVKTFFARLHALGFRSLTQAARYYDLGLALGDGEVSLLELVHAYSVLAQQGIDYPLHTQLEHGNSTKNSLRIFSPEVTSLIANILSDPWARQAEFGMDNILNFPVQTAVKTGTSTDYHDAWAIGFNYRYTVGVWLGNLNQKAMDGITGAIGPAMILRSVFAELNQYAITQPLYLSSQLIQKEVCVPQLLWQTKAQNCYPRTEYFIPEPRLNTLPIMTVGQNTIRLVKPSENLRLAIDPRIPLARQAFEFKVSGLNADDWIHWFVDQQPVKVLQGNYYLWPLSAGSHQVKIKVYRKDQLIYQSGIIHFVVKP